MLRRRAGRDRTMSLEEENKVIRDDWFAKYWNNKMSVEGVEITDGALKLHRIHRRGL
jgi:hypothetical protein